MSRRTAALPAQSPAVLYFKTERVEGLLRGSFVALWLISLLATSDAPPSLGLFVPQAFCWLLLTLSAAMFWLWRPDRCAPLDRLDIIIACWLGWLGISTSLVAGVGDMRAALNSLWHFVAWGLAWILGRRLFTPTLALALWPRLIALATVLLAVHGLYQYSVLTPSLVARIEAEPRQVLRDAGMDDDLTTPTAQAFLNRAKSPEPLASFALTNSLAGCLAVGIVLLGAEAAKSRTNVERSLRYLLMLLVGVCLLLTKSRTALAALALVAGIAGVRRWSSPRSMLTIVAALALVLVASMLVGLWIDPAYFTEAPKSVRYRLEYWHSTLHMSRDHWLTGVGLGNFQSVYTQYMLPQASEEIADPHQFLLEMAASTGLPGLLLFVTMLVATVRIALRDGRTNKNMDAAEPGKDGPPLNTMPRWLIGSVVAGLLGTPLAMQIGDMASDTCFGLPVIVVAGIPLAILFLLFMQRPSNPHTATSLLALAVLLINLLAAGGISFPSVTMVLLALLLPLSPADSGHVAPAPRGTRIRLAAGMLATWLLAAGCYGTCYRPVLSARGHLQVAEADLAQGLQATASAEAQLACAADPWSVEPWLLLARVNPGVIRSVDVARWSPGQPTVQERVGSLLQTVFGLKDCDEGFVAQVLSRNSRSSRNCEWLADIGFPTLDNAARKRLYTRAVELSPSRATLHAKLAWQQFLAHEITSKNQDGPEGDWQLARREAERALSLDALNPHKEQKLARRYFPPTMQTGNALLDTQFPSNRPVEELMQQLLAGTQETKPASAP